MDVGEEAPRTIISGLVEYVPIESMQVWYLEDIPAKSAKTASHHKLLKSLQFQQKIDQVLQLITLGYSGLKASLLALHAGPACHCPLQSEAPKHAWH